MKGQEVLLAVGDNKCLFEELFEEIISWKKNRIGYVVRGEGPLKVVLDGRMEGKREVGCQKGPAQR